MRVITKDVMKEAEAAAVSRGETYLGLMEKAGSAVADIIFKTVSPEGKTAVVLCGRGNNGGDGFVIARKLYESGYDTAVISLGEPLTEDSKAMLSALPSGVKLLSAEEGLCFITEADIIVDAVFGTGLTRNIEGDAERLLEAANDSRGVRFAVDIPSGVECDTGWVLGACFKADYTVSFERYKPCHILPPSNAYCGEVFVADIGIGEDVFGSLPFAAQIIEGTPIKKRDKNSHKGTFGTAISVTGSYGMSGASVLSSLAALRSGVGILKTACVEENYRIIAECLPESVLIPCPSYDGKYKAESIHIIKKQLKTADALLLGCGLGLSPDISYIVREAALSSKVPVVLDADGINAVADSIEFIKQMKAPLILTPHPGEMSRLCGKSVCEIERDRIGVAGHFATRFGVWLVLKGANTVVATPNGDIFVNVTGNPGMATGGSGDVLSGIIVSLLAEGMDVTDAVCQGVWLHGAAADRAALKRGEVSLLPRDILEELPYLLK